MAALGVLFASICFGLVPYFSKGLIEQGIPAHAIAFYRYILATVVLFPVLLRNRKVWREIIWGLIAGATMGLGWIGYVKALEHAPVSTVGVLYMTYPVFTMVIAWLLFSDRPDGRAIMASFLIVAAATIAGSPAAVSQDQLLALLVSLSAPFGFGFGICVLVHRLSRITPLARIASVSLGAVLGLTPLMISTQLADVLPSQLSDWILIIGIGLITAFIPQLIYTVCSPLIGTARTAVIGSVELPTMFFVGVIAFGEHITPSQAISCFLIVIAIVLTRSRATRNVATSITKH